MKSKILLVLALLLVFLMCPASIADSDFGNRGNTGDLTADGGFYVPLIFSSPDLTASLSDGRLYPPMTREANGLMFAKVREYTMMFPGSILGLSLRGSGALTAGSATVDVLVNDVAIGLTAYWGSGSRTASDTYTTQAKATRTNTGDAFSAGDRISLRVKTASALAPSASLDLLGMVLVEMGDQTTR